MSGDPTYFVLGRSWALHPARFTDRASYDSQGLWWDDGARFDVPPRTPVDVTLEPFNPLSPEQSPALPAFIDGVIPLFRDDLLAALTSAGVDNLDVYPARLIDPDDGQVHTQYKAVNVIGLVSAADMGRSRVTVHDGIPLVDVSFDSLSIDASKARGLSLFRLAENNGALLIHRRVKEHLVRAGFSELEFYVPENIAL